MTRTYVRERAKFQATAFSARSADFLSSFPRVRFKCSRVFFSRNLPVMREEGEPSLFIVALYTNHEKFFYVKNLVDGHYTRLNRE